MEFEPHTCAFRHLQRRSIGKLPVKVVTRNIEHDFFASVRVDELILGALSTNMRMGPQPYDFGIPQESDLHGRRRVVRRIRRDRKFRIVRGRKHSSLSSRCSRDDRGILACALHNKLFRRRRLRHSEADLATVHHRRAVGRVVKAHDNIRARAHQLSCVPGPVVVVGRAGQVTKIQILPQSRLAGSELHLRAAHISSGDDHSRQLAKAGIAGSRIAGFITWYLHPLIAVVHRRRLVFFEAEANVMHHRRVTRQNLH